MTTANDRHLNDQDEVLAVRSAVASLPPREKAIVIARFYLDLSVEDTAIALECAQGTVKAATSNAMARLRSSGLLDDEALEAP